MIQKYFLTLLILIASSCDTSVSMQRGKLLSQQSELKEQLYNKKTLIESMEDSVRKNQSLSQNEAFKKRLEKTREDSTKLDKQIAEIFEEIMRLDSIQYKK